MPIRHLNKLFYPRSLAVIGAAPEPADCTAQVMHNLLNGGFEGPIMPVSTVHRSIAGVLAYPAVDALPVVPDLAVICGPSAEVPPTLRVLGTLGTRAAIVLASAAGTDPDGRSQGFREEVRAAAAESGMRLLGPNCMGLIVPHIGLNASTGHLPAATGGVALVSQSSAMCLAVLDWAQQREIGFAHLVSLGDAVDVGFDDILDFLGNDAMTRAILLYVETIQRGPMFLSAARGASRNKPVLMIKGGRVREGQRLAMVRSRASVGEDAVFDAAIRRAGMLRVFSFGELFAAVETLARAKPLRGERLAIVATGYGIAIMAADSLRANGGQLAELSEQTLTKLDGVLAGSGYRNNPISIAPGTPAETYAKVCEALLSSPDVDALMVLHVPTGLASSTQAAQAVIGAAGKARRNVLTSWLGGATVEPARHLFNEAGIPTYDTPTEAIEAFLHMVRFRRNQEMLMETPPSTPLDFVPATNAVRDVVARGLAGGDLDLPEPEVKTILEAYGISTAEADRAATPEAAARLATHLGFPVSLKLVHSGHRHLPTAEGLSLDDPESVVAAADALLGEARSLHPLSPLPELWVRKIPIRPRSREVRIGVTCDPVFGPVIAFGQGGVMAALSGDRVFALPPLNMSLAKELVMRSEVSRTLAGSAEVPPADLEALYLTLVKISQLIIDIPEVTELDINPLLADERGVLAVEHRIRLTPTQPGPKQRLAIRPYPKELEEKFTLASKRQVLLRPIRPEDEPEHYEFLSKINATDLRLRFFGTVGRFSHSVMARFTQIDYDREMAFIATAPKPDGSGPETLGVVRTITDPGNETAEYAILVRSDLKGLGLGRKLLEKMVRYCRARGTSSIIGQVMRENTAMLDLISALGFESRMVPDEDLFEVVLRLS
jgi:acetyltransferase